LNITVIDINGNTWVSAADVWSNATRDLTDYNFLALPDWIWTGASTRDLTDYNQLEVTEYLADINKQSYDANVYVKTIAEVIDIWSFQAAGKTIYQYLDDVNSIVGTIETITDEKTRDILKFKEEIYPDGNDGDEQSDSGEDGQE